jgi:hypothetical protein
MFNQHDFFTQRDPTANLREESVRVQLRIDTGGPRDAR